MSSLSVDEIKRINPGLSQFYEMEMLRESKEPDSSALEITVGNTCIENRSSDLHSFTWTLTVVPSNADLVKQVKFELHPTFKPSTVIMDSEPYEIQRTGWGTFEVEIVVSTVTGQEHKLSHLLSFKEPTSARHAFPQSRFAGPTDSITDTSSPPKGSNRPTMTGVSEEGMHGHDGVGNDWKAPYMITECHKRARPAYSSMKAHEYSEQPDTLRKKVKMLARMLKQSKHCIAYTGAGISTSSGIDDYASSKTGKSAATGSGAGRHRPSSKKGLNAEPTFAHYTLTALSHERNGSILKHWVQQNHDGLPQKAGFPQSAINEIHGAWFDPSNPVVPMDGSLRDDLYHWLLKEEKETDLVLTMGTSLCGMNADRLVETASRKRLEMNMGLGSVIIGFQRTRLDELCSLRIFARIDEVMLLLAREMDLDFGPKPLTSYNAFEAAEDATQRSKSSQPHEWMYELPYDREGKLQQGTDVPKIRLDLSAGAEIMLTAGPGKGYCGTVHRTPSKAGKDFAWTIRCPCTRENSPEQGKKMQLYALGAWFIDEALEGRLAMLPIVNTPQWRRSLPRQNKANK